MKRRLALFVLALIVAGCGGDKDTTKDTPACPDLSYLPCAQPGLYLCGPCGETYSCSGGASHEWYRSDWLCECIDDEGNLLLWDTATQSGNPDCYQTM